MSRNLLHKTKFDNFKTWLTANGTLHREGRGEYQMLQVEVKPNNWQAIYWRIKDTDHYTVAKDIEPLVLRFIDSTNPAKPEAAKIKPMMVSHPIKSGLHPIQNVLMDLASQENCDGDPYDQMVQAYNHINDLEARLITLTLPKPELSKPQKEALRQCVITQKDLYYDKLSHRGPKPSDYADFRKHMKKANAALTKLGIEPVEYGA